MKAKRRGQNEGTIFERKDGRWCGIISLGWRDGKRRRKAVYGTTAAEVQDKLTPLKSKKLSGVPIETDRRTVARFLADWLSSVKSSVRVRTFEKYESTVNKHIVPQFGRMKLEKLGPQDVQALLDAKLAAGLHPRTVTGIRLVLCYALNQAMRWELLSRNVAALVKSPKIPRHEMKVWTEDQARKFIECCDNEPLGALYVLALYTGLRRGELCALRWSDVGSRYRSRDRPALFAAHSHGRFSIRGTENRESATLDQPRTRCHLRAEGASQAPSRGAAGRRYSLEG